MDRPGDDWFEDEESGEGGWVESPPPRRPERESFDPGPRREPDPFDTAERLRRQVELDTEERERLEHDRVEGDLYGTAVPGAEGAPSAPSGRRGRRRGRRGRGRRREGERPRPRRERDELDGEGRAPSGWLARHRDLPARVRRRQAGVAIAVVAALLVGGIVLASGGGGGGEEEPLGLKRLVGQTIAGKVPNGGPDQRLIRRVRRGQLGGIIVGDDQPERLRGYVARLQNAARSGGNPPLLVMIDQEGGNVKRVAGPPDAAPNVLGRLGSADAAREEGRRTGAFLRSLGINVDLAPVIDVASDQTAETIASRTYGEDASVVAELGVAFSEGLQSERVAATPKHFPGLGPATINTDFGEVSIAASQEQLETGMEPFRAAVEAGVRLVMVATAEYPGLGAAKPAVTSAKIVEDELRGQLGFTGVIVTDDLEAAAISSQMAPAAAAIASIRAGCDLALLSGTVPGSARAFDAVVKAAKTGKLERAVLEDAYERVTSLKSDLAAG